MKKVLLTLAVLLCSFWLIGQTISTFEDVLSGDSLLNGSESPLGTTYESGSAIFPNYYDTAWGGYWSNGFAITNISDSSTGDFSNLYGNITGSGYMSNSFAVAKHNSVIKIKGEAQNRTVKGFYLTNTTYAYHVVKDGNQFSKRFGGDTGNDPDYFRLVVKAYSQGILGADSVVAYLADYRFSDNQQDYILKDWEWVDLTNFGNADSILFTLETTDVGSFGPNTPYFFAIDDFTVENGSVGIFDKQDLTVNVYPNPAQDYILIEDGKNQPAFILNAEGKLVKNIATNRKEDVSTLQPGVYFVQLGTAVSKLVIQ
ncbi:DUF4465 domain-containing protein [Luteibaculum oceani]|uniref:DUF4465 domain-containing protein n=1 Tax=Luteibaculum oceani TaxID=1294296 RepID=A0A5C6UUA6_9FLAO|nr:DUF4465 domain-containing protein [Luteibaculum oceani]TXC76200.1 DUF4465 domain-containing protein [Luteibaculum oceani]